MPTVISGDTGIDKVQDGVVVAADLADGALVEDSANSIGYGTGAGGTVTQATSKSTAVTLNKPTGQITMNNAALAAGAVASFVCSNSIATASDVLIANIAGGVSSGANYSLRSYVGSGGGAISFSIKNESAGSLSEAVVINFAIIKGATA